MEMLVLEDITALMVHNVNPRIGDALSKAVSEPRYCYFLLNQI